ncbi:hypothetical protein [Turicibacter sanguinis]|nr:hypothetical protein [Turicibacter sanguinis]MDB8553242.1 hypothetical protein [Turicibacter sanguinis]
MELIIKHDSNVKITICKDETTISTVVSKGNQSSSIVQTTDRITTKVGSY